MIPVRADEGGGTTILYSMVPPAPIRMSYLDNSQMHLRAAASTTVLQPGCRSNVYNSASAWAWWAALECMHNYTVHASVQYTYIYMLVL